ncbi:hypothetical protein [Nocardia sp. NBC_01009]|uniref:hypothetical protein n=1 Tax=Nocardia sp. NBC_01009 TaxID=2975996 RepID=UPI003869417C|nr:hypothetical protein OHA42_14620 [Nocardia sp. NBC_01009]
MFDEWQDEFDPPSYRVVDPPMRVVVDLGRLISMPDAVFNASSVPLRVKNGGLELAGNAPGLLHAWARTSSLHLASSSTESAAALTIERPHAAPARHG